MSKPTTNTSSNNNTKSSSTDTSLAPLLRHFVGISIIVETKQGRTFRGIFREADAYMNLVLSRTSNKGNQTTISTAEGVLASEEFDLVHIRGPSIRYGANVDITGVPKLDVIGNVLQVISIEGVLEKLLGSDNIILYTDKNGAP